MEGNNQNSSNTRNSHFIGRRRRAAEGENSSERRRVHLNPQLRNSNINSNVNSNASNHTEILNRIQGLMNSGRISEDALESQISRFDADIEGEEEEYDVDKNVLKMIEAYSNFRVKNYICRFCHANGHLADKCPIKLSFDKIAKKDPILSKQWGAYKFSRVDIEAKRLKEERLTAARKEKRENLEMAQAKFDKNERGIAEVQGMIQNLVIRNIRVPDFNLRLINEINRPQQYQRPRSENIDITGVHPILQPDAVVTFADKRVCNNDVGKVDQCTICMSTPVLGDLVSLLECRHHFHSACFEQWLNGGQDSPTCPICKRIVNPIKTSSDE